MRKRVRVAHGGREERKRMRVAHNGREGCLTEQHSKWWDVFCVAPPTRCLAPRGCGEVDGGDDVVRFDDESIL